MIRNIVRKNRVRGVNIVMRSQDRIKEVARAIVGSYLFSRKDKWGLTDDKLDQIAKSNPEVVKKFQLCGNVLREVEALSTLDQSIKLIHSFFKQESEVQKNDSFLNAAGRTLDIFRLRSDKTLHSVEMLRFIRAYIISLINQDVIYKQNLVDLERKIKAAAKPSASWLSLLASKSIEQQEMDILTGAGLETCEKYFQENVLAKDPRAKTLGLDTFQDFEQYAIPELKASTAADTKAAAKVATVDPNAAIVNKLLDLARSLATPCSAAENKATAVAATKTVITEASTTTAVSPAVIAVSSSSPQLAKDSKDEKAPIAQPLPSSSLMASATTSNPSSNWAAGCAKASTVPPTETNGQKKNLKNKLIPSGSVPKTSSVAESSNVGKVNKDEDDDIPELYVGSVPHIDPDREKGRNSLFGKAPSVKADSKANSAGRPFGRRKKKHK